MKCYKIHKLCEKVWKYSAENPKNGPKRFLGEIQNKVDKTNPSIAYALSSY